MPCPGQRRRPLDAALSPIQWPSGVVGELERLRSVPLLRSAARQPGLPPSEEVSSTSFAEDPEGAEERRRWPSVSMRYRTDATWLEGRSAQRLPPGNLTSQLVGFPAYVSISWIMGSLSTR
jgi:hypothetical protein